MASGVVTRWWCLVALAGTSQAFFDQFFHQQHQQQQQQQQQQNQQLHDHEATFMSSSCDKYVCQDTLTCVDGPLDCPCPFPNSQVKCVFPDLEGFVCVSKGERECDWVSDAYNGLL